MRVNLQSIPDQTAPTTLSDQLFVSHNSRKLHWKTQIDDIRVMDINTMALRRADMQLSEVCLLLMDVI